MDTKTWSEIMGKPISFTLSGALLAAAATAACSPDEADPVPRTDPEIIYSNVWSADSNIDLFSRGAELVRASAEGGDYTYFVGVDKSYPGYSSAVGGPADDRNPDKSEFLTWRDPLNSKAIPKTEFQHITAYAASTSAVTATVCSYSLFPDPGDNASLKPLSTATQIELVNTGTDPGLPGIKDADPAHNDSRAHRPPTWNVFGTWRIQKIRFIRAAPDDPIPQGCTDWWHKQFPTFIEQPGNILSQPPGFQAPTQPVAIQYPEWIGPAKPE